MAKNINFGFIKDGLVNSTTSLYLNESKLTNDLKDFLKVVKSSPVLTLEYIVYKNIENKYIADDVLATRYIDENISLLKKFTKKEIISENNKLSAFERDYQISQQKEKLYESISTIILENTSDNRFKNVDKIHGAFENVLNYIKNNKSNQELNENKSIFEEYKDKYLNIDFVFNNAIKKFNEKYSHLSEGEKRILKVLIKEDNTEKEKLFNTLINESLDKIENLLVTEESAEVSNKLQKVKQKINEMKFNEESLIDDIVKINTLKESL
jgi:hypothetical protein